MKPTPKSELKDGAVYLRLPENGYIKISRNNQGKPNAQNMYGRDDPYSCDLKAKLSDNSDYYEVGSQYELLYHAKKQALTLLSRLEISEQNSDIIYSLCKP
jgi:hypothetical protein